MGLAKIEHDMSQKPDYRLKFTDQSLNQHKRSPWFDLRIFYLRVSNFEIKNSTPDQLTLVYIPLGPYTVLSVNGKKDPAYLDHVSTSLRLNRSNMGSEEAVFASTDSVEVTGSVGFELLQGEDLLISGVLELKTGEGCDGKAPKIWTLDCQSHIIVDGSRKGRRRCSLFRDSAQPLADIYVAGSFNGNPIILSRTIELLPQTKSDWKLMLDTIPEHETSETNPNKPLDASKEWKNSIPENKPGGENELKRRHHWPCYLEDEDLAISWFNTGMRVGFGISVGICVGVGIGVGLLAKTFQANSSRFRRRLFF